MENTAMAISGVAYLFLFVLGLVVTIVWVVFPFIVIGKANKIIEHLKQVEYQVQLSNYNQDKERREGIQQ